MTKINELLISEKLMFVRPEVSNNSSVTQEHIICLSNELAAMGYVLRLEAISSLKSAPLGAFCEVTDTLFSVLSSRSGVNVRYMSLYPEFPHTVPSRDKITSVNSNILKSLTDFYHDIENSDEFHHILACGHQVPNIFTEGCCPVCMDASTSQPSPAHIPVRSFETIDVCEETYVADFIKSKFEANMIIDCSLKEKLIGVARAGEFNFRDVVIDSIPFKENLGIYINCVSHDASWSDLYDSTKAFVNGPKDITRIVSALSNINLHDSQNSSISEYYKLTTRDKKYIASLVNNDKLSLEDFKAERSTWIKINMIVHFGAFKKRFPVAFKNINQVINHEKQINSFNAEFESLIRKKNLDRLLLLLSRKPGIFVRRLDNILRENPDKVDIILDTLSKCALGVSKRVLLGARKHFMQRMHGDLGERGYVSKRGTYRTIDKQFVPLCGSISRKAIAAIDSILGASLKKDEYTRKTVFIDPKLYTIKLPINLRTSKTTINIVESGSQLNLNATNAVGLRPFIYWKENNESGRIDLDLSVAILDSDLETVDSCSFRDRNSIKSGMTHSGDYTSAPNGATEFVDIELPILNESRYIVTYINTFTGQSFDTFEAFGGIMIFDSEDKRKELFSPQAVVDKFDLTGEASSIIACIYDVNDASLIWSGNSLRSRAGDSITSSSEMIKRVVRKTLIDKKCAMSIGELLDIVALSNDMIKAEEENAEVIFSLDIASNIDGFRQMFID